LSERARRRIWTPAQTASGASFTLYDLRHTFASRLLAAGIPAAEVAGWMGHSLRAGGRELTNTTTLVYAHPTHEHSRAALDELYALMGASRDGVDMRQKAWRANPSGGRTGRSGLLAQRPVSAATRPDATASRRAL